MVLFSETTETKCVKEWHPNSKAKNRTAQYRAAIAILNLIKNGFWPFRSLCGPTRHARTKFQQNMAVCM